MVCPLVYPAIPIPEASHEYCIRDHEHFDDILDIYDLE